MRSPSRALARLVPLALLGSLLLAACRAATPRADAGAPARIPPAAEDARAPDELHLVVLHVNDVHGQVVPRVEPARDGRPARVTGGLERLAAEIERQTALAEAEGAEVLVVDAGDWFQGTPEGALEQGRAFCRAYATLGFDALALGNHELDHGLEPLVRLLREVELPVVCANLAQREDGRRPAWVAPWRVVERAGWRIALVGLLTPQTPTITHRDASSLRFDEPIEALEQARAALRDQADWILPVTHLGLGEDRELARGAPWLDLIVGGHSHTFLREGVREGRVLIVQVGTKARALGRVDLWLSRAREGGAEGGLAERSQASVLELDEEPPAARRVARVQEACARLVAATEAEMAEVLGTLSAPATRAREGRGSSVAGSLVADLFRARTGADVGVMNRGGLRTDLAAGPLTRRDVFDFLPFDNHLVTLELSGAELRELVRRGVEDETRSGIELSGLLAHVGRDGGRPRLLEVVLLAPDGSRRPLEPERGYRVALNSFLADGGDAFLPPGVSESAPRAVDPILMRELLELALRERTTLEPPADARVVEVAP